MRWLPVGAGHARPGHYEEKQNAMAFQVKLRDLNTAFTCVNPWATKARVESLDRSTSGSMPCVAHVPKEIKARHCHAQEGRRSDTAETGRRRTGLPGKAELKMKTKPPRKTTPRITESSGNVFADLGFANPEPAQYFTRTHRPFCAEA
jgi:hypothetical protein